MTVLGTRPEAIKMLPVVRALRAHGFRHSLCITGQHREMLAQVFAVFAEAPDIDLALMRPGQPPTALLAAILHALPPVLDRLRPDMLLVHGDTSTALAAALAAFHAGIPVGHVEAGLRSGDLARPFPEEMNRVAVDGMAALRFAPTQAAADNLAREYNSAAPVIVTGNTAIDALLDMAARLDARQASGGLERRHGAGGDAPALQDPSIAPARRLILVTAHRRESFGPGFARICDGLAALAARGDVRLVYPVHPNPAVREAVQARLANRANIELTEPLDYPAMVQAMRQSSLIITDSGGLQEEGPALGKPVLVLRDVTERPEALASGAVRLVGTNPDRLVAEAALLLDDPVEYAKRAQPSFPFGDGQAAPRIAAAIARFFGP